MNSIGKVQSSLSSQLRLKVTNNNNNGIVCTCIVFHSEISPYTLHVQSIDNNYN